MEHIAFPSIDQFRHVIKSVAAKARWSGNDENGDPIFDRTKPLPKLMFLGTVKLHGTNASVVLDGDTTRYQSRNNIITPEDDNAGFARWADSIDVGMWKSIVPKQTSGEQPTIVIYGEWCGKGIQKGVGISELDKMFVIFKVRVGDDWFPVSCLTWSDDMRWSNIHRITDFTHFYETVDFNNPEVSQNRFIAITEEVERECPVALKFGVSGVGEGVVWSCIETGYTGSNFMFKVKGEKHSVSKVKTLAAVDIEMVNSLKEFAERNVTENRCLQGVNYLKEQGLEVTEKTTGLFLRWLYNDIIKEEQDTINASGLDAKQIGSVLAKFGRIWYFNYLNVDNS